MVSNLSIGLLTFSAALSVLFPVALLGYYRRKEKISFKPVIIGALIWFIFTQVLEKILHVFVINAGLMNYTLLFSIYGALAAGIFEEVGRFAAFKIFLKNKREWKDGMAYGIGHGGFEAILIGLFGSLQSIMYAKLLNSGNLESLLAGKVSLAQIEALKVSLTGPSYLFAIGGIERVFAVIIHIALTFVVLYGIRNRKNIFLLYAILLHALVDFLPGLYQTHIIKNVLVVELLVFLMACIALVGIVKSKKLFSANPIVHGNGVGK
jgi:uncharacterized membrane protein YhfC